MQLQSNEFRNESRRGHHGTTNRATRKKSGSVTQAEYDRMHGPGAAKKAQDADTPDQGPDMQTCLDGTVRPRGECPPAAEPEPEKEMSWDEERKSINAAYKAGEIDKDEWRRQRRANWKKKPKRRSRKEKPIETFSKPGSWTQKDLGPSYEVGSKAEKKAIKRGGQAPGEAELAKRLEGAKTKEEQQRIYAQFKKEQEVKGIKNISGRHGYNESKQKSTNLLTEEQIMRFAELAQTQDSVSPLLLEIDLSPGEHKTVRGAKGDFGGWVKKPSDAPAPELPAGEGADVSQFDEKIAQVDQARRKALKLRNDMDIKLQSLRSAEKSHPWVASMAVKLGRMKNQADAKVGKLTKQLETLKRQRAEVVEQHKLAQQQKAETGAQHDKEASMTCPDGSPAIGQNPDGSPICQEYGEDPAPIEQKPEPKRHLGMSSGYLRKRGWEWDDQRGDYFKGGKDLTSHVARYKKRRRPKKKKPGKIGTGNPLQGKKVGDTVNLQENKQKSTKLLTENEVARFSELAGTLETLNEGFWDDIKSTAGSVLDPTGLGRKTAGAVGDIVGGAQKRGVEMAKGAFDVVTGAQKRGVEMAKGAFDVVTGAQKRGLEFIKDLAGISQKGLELAIKTSPAALGMKLAKKVQSGEVDANQLLRALSPLAAVNPAISQVIDAVSSGGAPSGTPSRDAFAQTPGGQMTHVDTGTGQMITPAQAGVSGVAGAAAAGGQSLPPETGGQSLPPGQSGEEEEITQTTFQGSAAEESDLRVPRPRRHLGMSSKYLEKKGWVWDEQKGDFFKGEKDLTSHVNRYKKGRRRKKAPKKQEYPAGFSRAMREGRDLMARCPINN